MNVFELIFNASFAGVRANYMRTIGAAAAMCGVAKVDYECADTPAGHAGIVSASDADAYTDFLVELQAALGNDSYVSADLGVWGWDGAYGKGSSYPLELTPWVNASKLAAHDHLFVNTMSYHTPDDCSTALWQLDGAVMSDVWGIPRAQINLGVGFYGFNASSHGEPTWGDAASACPDAPPDSCHCSGVAFVSKTMAREIGTWVRERGFRGCFPWAANYDALGDNALIPWIARGLSGR